MGQHNYIFQGRRGGGQELITENVDHSGQNLNARPSVILKS